MTTKFQESIEISDDQSTECASKGAVRLKKASSLEDTAIYCRKADGSGDVCMGWYSASNDLFIGNGPSYADQPDQTVVSAVTDVSLKVGSATKLVVNSTGVAFNGATPVARPTYSVSNLVTDRSYNANSTSTAELADVLGTLIADLRALGLVL